MDFEITIPEWWSVMHYDKSYDDPFIMGFDTESVTGQPYLLQFWHPTLQRYFFVNGTNTLKTFLEFLDAVPEYRIILICYYAKFDLPLLFFQDTYRFADDSFEMRRYGWDIKVFCGKNWWASFHKSGKYVQLVDAFNFFKGGLDKSSKSLGIRVRKLPKPKGLGERAFSRTDKKFLAYAMQDARISYEEGRLIAIMHREFDIPVTLSAPKMAELVFRKHFLADGEEYLLPKDDKCLAYSIHAYHGAKNGYYLDHPAFFQHVYDYDIISAYPFAMHILPSFLSGSYREVRRFEQDVINYPGVYYVVGELKPCRYGILSTPGFRFVREGGKIKTFATGYEIKEALRSGELRIEYINGFVFASKTLRNPLRDYVEFFFNKKKSAKKKSARYEFYKLLLNSLYGKWIQTNPVVGEKIVVGEDFDMKLLPTRKVAAGLFNPFIAANITGFIRAELHRLEHKYHAIETSTDSFKTLRQIHLPPSMKRLGGLEQKFAGKALFCRNRLNLLLGRNGKIEGFALHGFWGSPQDLHDLYLSRSHEYMVSRIPLIRESLLHAGKQAFRMQDEVRTLNVNWNHLRYYKRRESC